MKWRSSTRLAGLAGALALLWTAAASAQEAAPPAAVTRAAEALLRAIAAEQGPATSAPAGEQEPAGVPFIMRFEETVRGLEIGAPVEFRGLRLGSVSDIHAIVDAETNEASIVVTIALNPDRIRLSDREIEDPQALVDELVARGLRAELVMGSLLSGTLIVALDFHPDAPPAVVASDGPHPEIPTVPSNLQQMRHSIDQALADLSQLPLRELVEDLRRNIQAIQDLPLDDLMASMRGAVEGMDTLPIQELVEDLRNTVQAIEDLANSLNLEESVQALNRVTDAAAEAMGQVDSTMLSLDGFVGPDSELRYAMTELMGELTDASRSLRAFAEILAQNPEALLYGKDGGDDYQ